MFPLLCEVQGAAECLAAPPGAQRVRGLVRGRPGARPRPAARSQLAGAAGRVLTDNCVARDSRRPTEEVFPMEAEKIKVRVTETGQALDVIVYSKRADRIEIVLGEGIH